MYRPRLGLGHLLIVQHSSKWTDPLHSLKHIPRTGSTAAQFSIYSVSNPPWRPYFTRQSWC